MQSLNREVTFNGSNIVCVDFYGDGYIFNLDAAARSVSGLQAGGTDLEEIKFFNNSPNTVLTLEHDSQSAPAGCRFYFADSLPKALPAGVPFWLVYKEGGPSGSGWYGEAAA